MSIDVTGIGAVADLVSTTINKIWPDKSEEDKQALAAAMLVVQGQIDIDKLEAGNASVFVSGWRPALGWACVSACIWNWLGLPVAAVVLTILHNPIVLQGADLSQMWPVLLGMLGLGGLRTVEKIQGVAAK